MRGSGGALPEREKRGCAREPTRSAAQTGNRFLRCRVSKTHLVLPPAGEGVICRSHARQMTDEGERIITSGPPYTAELGSSRVFRASLCSRCHLRRVATGRYSPSSPLQCAHWRGASHAGGSTDGRGAVSKSPQARRAHADGRAAPVRIFFPGIRAQGYPLACVRKERCMSRHGYQPLSPIL